MAALISLETAKDHVRLTHSEEDTLVQMQIELATGLVLAYLEAEANVDESPAVWDETTVPADVKAAILVQFGELWRHRGDGAELPARGVGGVLSPQAEGYVKMRRPIALA